MSQPTFIHTPDQLKQLAQDVLGFAKALGAAEAAVAISEGGGLSVSVRKGQIETIEQNKDKGIGVTVYLGGERATRRVVVKDGVVQGYFLSTYSARKLGMTTTGNAGGSHNLILRSGATKRSDNFEAMLRKLGTGLLVTELMGQGVNYVTGDYSRGASGFWVENGVIQYPVEEITIAGNMQQMLEQIVAVGSDTIIRGGKQSGSILIENMTVAGG